MLRAEEGNYAGAISIDVLLNGLSSELTLRFFAVFARLEFAMKHSGYVFRMQNGAAQASRKHLADKLTDAFFSKIVDRGSAEYLISHPPRNYIVERSGGLSFADRPEPITTTQQLFAAVWQVRNNLFHGNKQFPANRERDEKLMSDALAVIEAVLETETTVGAAFQEPQEFF